MNSTTQISPQVIEEHGLTLDEYQMIVKILARDPNIVELGIFSVMWSEHCSYKNSKQVLKLFPTDGPEVLVKAGEENAGVIDIGEGWGVCFKMESHNHPSAIEPFQGAATGVGGIIRDIFTMGARPVALMDALRFGCLEKPNVQRLLSGVVSGIAHYGNCIGIPTVGGDIYFDDSYDANPLVNVFCLGVIRTKDLIKGKAEGVGNPVYYVGAATGRDGIHGATFASDDLTQESEEKRSAVQVGDPFMEKLLLEACLEVIQSGNLVGIQDMGAAGLTCAICETASRGNSGISIELAKVPQRETNMTPYEILLSESQERMLMIVKKGKEKEVEEIMSKWDLHAVHVGQVEVGTQMKVYFHGELVADIPARKLAEDGPVYEREIKEPEYLKRTREFDTSRLEKPKDINKVFLSLLSSPSIASKNWVYDQYDHMVRTNTVCRPGGDSAVIRLKGTNKMIAMSTDCNAGYCYLNPYTGGQIAVAEAARNVVCSGAKPIGVTDCLNFGNPMKPEVFWQFRKCVEGVSDACRAFKIPVTGGNVSLYNENPNGPIDPTPMIGLVGVIDMDQAKNPDLVPVNIGFKDEGDLVLLLGETFDDLGGSEYLKIVHGVKSGDCPRLDLDKEINLQKCLLALIYEGYIKSAHDCSEGGIAVSIAEACFYGQMGVEIHLENL
ncbi:phosphoribosylformylglycinamidine synthase subunit PurL, partial [PVC group bacterium]|nr:phosphoribosylformylglycinamidine synthase subunit PurL [PVC group bacterium]